MGAVWETRIVRGDDDKLRFAEVRFRVDGSTTISGIMSVTTEGGSLEDMQTIAKQLQSACERAVIGPDGEDPERQEDEDEEEDDWEGRFQAALRQDWEDEARGGG